ncbi:hypothetical protein EZV73_27770 [Acidaminobacter sp. JC074]|uniref:phage integrase N-terminal domain-containing protein n=1 Tax=Acidaminobacter sp. JC074 TaxID=2530199 RepID=UPI001F0EBDB2|nr:phage integrase N-terminal domain-containing protein [Acidaminobacter sp. JC074]MCH4891400.1 hypothetical protein [Acidaminobacter sp. JC074]
MARMSKMDYQMHLRMEQMKCIGESRHNSKKEYMEMMGNHYSNRTMGIHSHLSYDAIKQTSIEFIGHLRKEYKDIKDISQIKKEHVEDYLKFRQDDGKAAATISKDMAALNKLFNLHITKKECGIKNRSFKDITRSRGPKAHDSKYNPNNYEEQITLAKACGYRRESVLVITPERFLWENGLPYKVYLIEKGGKERDATIIKDYRESVKEILKDKPEGDPMFKKYTSKIDNNAFRREYAQNRYRELVNEKGFEDKSYRGFDPELLRKLSNDLGHNRLDVTIYNYLL